MNQLTFIFRILDYVKATFIKLENWRMQQQTIMKSHGINSHTLHDIGVRNAMGFMEATKRMSEK